MLSSLRVQHQFGPQSRCRVSQPLVYLFLGDPEVVIIIFLMHKNERNMQGFMKALEGTPGLIWVGLPKEGGRPDSSAIDVQYRFGGSRSSVVGDHESGP